jgi:hypothetical protein
MVWFIFYCFYVLSLFIYQNIKRIKYFKNIIEWKLKSKNYQIKLY